jgi:hypothetical protein
MSASSRSLRLKRLAAILAAVISTAALAVPSTPAQSRVFVGFGIGAPVGWGYYAPRSYYGYYRYPYYPYYPAYYGHPGFFIGGAIGPHHHGAHHWHHR